MLAINDKMKYNMVAQTKQMAGFALNASYDQLPASTIDQLKRHLLDSVGSLIFAQDQPVIVKLKKAINGLYGQSQNVEIDDLPMDQLAQYFTALIRYPDFMDNFLAKESTCHPSDNIGALLAVGQKRPVNGKEFLLAMAIGYEIECRLTEEMPVMVKGFDHTALLAFSVTAALARLLSLSEEQTSCALGIAGSTFNPLVTSRAAYTTEWKGLASSSVTGGCTSITLMAKNGMTGPVDLFEKPEKGYNAIYGMDLKYQWEKDKFDLIPRCILKSYNAEVHTQSSLEALLELRNNHPIDVAQIEKIDVSTFLTAFHIVGGGEYGDRKEVHSKEQADHSLPYLMAVVLLDGQVYPEQLYPERINRPDVQELLQKIHVHTSFPLHKPVKLAGLLDKKTEAYPEKVMTEVTIHLKDGKKLSLEKETYNGFVDNPFTWNDTIVKFKKLTQNKVNESTQNKIIEMIQNLEDHSIAGLLKKLIIKEPVNRKEPMMAQQR
jgi:2-methylcitrate dehydratase